MHNNYMIGIVDDDNTHVLDIKRVFARYGKINNIHIDFQTFYESENVDYKKIITSVIEAIREQKVDCVIIDYKLVFVQETNKGADLINEIRDNVSGFPCIILTGRADECVQEFKVDPDKIYVKRDFLAISTAKSDEMVKKILMNIDIVKQRKAVLQAGINTLKEQLREFDGDSNKIIEQIISLESKLSKYCVVEHTALDEFYDSTALEKIVDLLDKANELLD